MSDDRPIEITPARANPAHLTRWPPAHHDPGAGVWWSHV